MRHEHHRDRHSRQRVLIVLLTLVSGLLHPVLATTAAADPGAAALAGDLIVAFDPASGPLERRRALEAFHLDVVRSVAHLDLVRVRPRRGAVSQPTLVGHPAVASAHGIARFQASSVTPPNDPNFRYQWNLPLIQVPDAWSVSNGTGATVAVLDSGVAYESFGAYQQAPDLAGTTFVAGYDFIDNDAHPNDDIDPAAPSRPAHGTHVAGVIAQTTNNARSQAGVAPGAALMPVRVLDRSGGGDDDQIAAGIVFATDGGAQVINMSFDSPDDAPMTRAAVAYAASKGVTMVAAAGNTGASPVRFPARYPEVLGVGAVRYDRTRAYYSSFGPALGDIDLVAPGGDLRVDQNGDGSPDGILQQTMVSTTNGFVDHFLDGTSAAAPHVAAAAALLVGSGLATTPAQIRRALESSADRKSVV